MKIITALSTVFLTTEGFTGGKKLKFPGLLLLYLYKKIEQIREGLIKRDRGCTYQSSRHFPHFAFTF